MLLACALAEEDEFGFFAATDVGNAAAESSTSRPSPAAFARHLEGLSSETRGAVLQKHGRAKTARFRFVNPLLQPYVAMRGVSEGVVRASDLQLPDKRVRDRNRARTHRQVPMDPPFSERSLAAPAPPEP